MPGQAVRNQIADGVKRIVVKVGTSSLCDELGRLDIVVLRSLCNQLAGVMKSGVSVTLVASGAVGAGLAELDLSERPKTVDMLQAVAAVGQGQLMRTFHDVFARKGIRVGQVLLTRDDFENRAKYLNIRNTLMTLGRCEVMAIVNENDAVAIDEFRYGDNDIIAAMLTNMLSADLLIMLTSVAGLLKGKKVVDVVETIDDKILALVSRGKSKLGSGGMAGKLAAAQMVMLAGEKAAIANAREKNIIPRILAGEQVGTIFLPAKRKMTSRKRWIGQASRNLGKITIDAGAERALLKKGKSLLPSGIVSVEGKFKKGASIIITGPDGSDIARGLSNYPAEQIKLILGLKTSQIFKALGEKPYDVVVHRDNMVILEQ